MNKTIYCVAILNSQLIFTLLMGAHGMEKTPVNVNLRLDIEGALKEKRAFDEKTAADLAITTLDLVPVLDIMVKSGLIARTPEGKVFMTSKGLEQSNRGFKVSSSQDRKFVRFSRTFPASSLK
jgi:hypothetical protein